VIASPRTTPPTAGGTAWTFSVLHRFTGFPSDGAYPGGNLILDAAGNLYGTTAGGGDLNKGTVFEVTP